MQTASAVLPGRCHNMQLPCVETDTGCVKYMQMPVAETLACFAKGACAWFCRIDACMRQLQMHVSTWLRPSAFVIWTAPCSHTHAAYLTATWHLANTSPCVCLCLCLPAGRSMSHTVCTLVACVQHSDKSAKFQWRRVQRGDQHSCHTTELDTEI